MKLTKAQRDILVRMVNLSHINDFTTQCQMNRYPKTVVDRADVRSLKRRGLIEMRRPGNWDLTNKGKAVAEYEAISAALERKP